MSTRYFVAAYVYRGTRHTYYREGKKMTDPIVVVIDGNEWRQFGSLKQAEKEAIEYIRGTT